MIVSSRVTITRLQRESSSAFASHLKKDCRQEIKHEEGMQCKTCKEMNHLNITNKEGCSHEKLSSSLQVEPRFFILGHRWVYFLPFGKFDVSKMQNSSHYTKYGILKNYRQKRKRTLMSTHQSSWNSSWPWETIHKYLLLRTHSNNIHCPPCGNIFFSFIKPFYLKAIWLIEIMKCCWLSHLELLNILCEKQNKQKRQAKEWNNDDKLFARISNHKFQAIDRTKFYWSFYPTQSRLDII